MPRGRLLKEPEEISNIDANQAPTNEPTVFPKFFIDMNRANKVPSIPGGQSCPDKIRNGINLFLDQKKDTKMKSKTVVSNKKMSWCIILHQSQLKRFLTMESENKLKNDIIFLLPNNIHLAYYHNYRRVQNEKKEFKENQVK